MSRRSRQRERDRRARVAEAPGPRREATPWWRFLRYALVFCGVTAVLEAASYLPPASNLLRAYARANCAAAGTVLNSLGQYCSVDGLAIRSHRFVLEATVGCMATDLVVFCCAVALAYPAPLRRTMAGLVAGVGALVGLNLLRIVTVFLAGAYLPALFATVHEEVWPGVMVLSAVAVMMLWMAWAARQSGRAGTAVFLPAYLRRFVMVYGLLLLPWPGLAGLCRGVLCTTGTGAFSSAEGPREIRFIVQDAHETRIEIANRRLLHADGSGPVRNVDLSAYALLWRPTSLFLALVLAAPLSLRVRLPAVGLGAALLIAVLWFTVGYVLWNESTEVALHTLSGAWKTIANDIEETILVLISLSLPLLVALGSLMAVGAFRVPRPFDGRADGLAGAI